MAVQSKNSQAIWSDKIKLDWQIEWQTEKLNDRLKKSQQ
jgi:hypothetical protein